MREEIARLVDSLAGSVRLGDDDPRWNSLLRFGSRLQGLSLSDPKMQDFGNTMLQNNPATGNFGTLMVLTTRVVEEAIQAAVAVATGTPGIAYSNPSQIKDPNDRNVAAAEAANATCGEAFGRAVAALRLTRLFAGPMVSTLDASHLRTQIYSRAKLNTGVGGDRSSGTGRGVVYNGGLHRIGLDNGDADGDYHHITTPVTVPGGNVIVNTRGGARSTSGRGGNGGNGIGGGISTVGITEGMEEEAEHAAASAPGIGGTDVSDPVVSILVALVSLLSAGEEEGHEKVSAVAGFGDLQLEGVGLLLVLLGTQAYGLPPSPDQKQRQHYNSHGPRPTSGSDNLFLDVLMREAGTTRRLGRGGLRNREWGVALSRAALGWFIRRPAAPLGSAASALVNALSAPARSRRFPIAFRQQRKQQQSTSSSLIPAEGGDGNGASRHAAMRILAAPGALVLLFARVILYVITLRGLVGVANRDNSGGGAKEREHYLEYGYAGEEVTEAVGGAPVEPGEWEGNNSSGGPKKLSPLADRGVLLLLVLLHNRRSSSSSSNAFRAAVTSCVDADAHDDRPTVGSAKTSGRGPKATEAVAADKAGLERVASRVGGGRDSGHSGAAGAPAPMRISFRGMFEAFAATLETSPSRRGGGRGTGSYGNGGKKGALDGQEGVSVEGVGQEGVALLLYSILQANPGFLRAAVVRSDADALLLPLLRTLHDCPSLTIPRGNRRLKQKQKQQQHQNVRSSSPALYVPAIVVLLYSQDSAFDRQSFRQVVQCDIPWGLGGRNLKGASLGSLVVLSLVRCLVHNLGSLQDDYLLENCLAVLVNLAPQVEHLPPYVAQRLVSILVTASRRWIEGASAAAASASATASLNGNIQEAAGGGSEREVADGEDIIAVGGLSDVQELCGEVARVLFLFVWRCTRPRRLGKNVELLYALLHAQASLEAIWNHPAMVATGWAGDLPRLLEHFQTMAKKEEEEDGGASMTVESAMEMIQKGVRHYTTEAMGMGRDAGAEAAEDGRGAGGGGVLGAGTDYDDGVITLLYEEGENPEAFFLPYLWQLVVARTPDLNWNPRKIRIFNPPAVATSELAAAAPVEAVKAVGSAILNENIDPSRGSSIGAGDERSVDVGGNGEVLGAGHESTKEDEVQDMIAGDLRV